MADDVIDVREAGRQIAERGFADDVRRGPTNRERARGDTDTDADDRTEDRRERKRRDEDDDRPRSRRREEPDLDDEDDEEPARRRDDADEDDEDDDADTSTREDGEDGDDDQDDDDDADGEDDRNQRERMFKVKVNGKTLEVPESELIRGYSRNKDYQHKTQKLSETGRNLHAGHAKVAEEYGQRLASLGALTNKLKTMLVGEVNGEEMRALRAKDPQAWQIARMDYEDRIKQVDAVFNHLNSENERHRNAVQQTQAQHAAHTVQFELERMREHIPDWLEARDGKPAGHQRVAKYLRDAGFQDAEFMGIVDHRMLLIADKARRYDAMVKRQNERDQPQRRAKPIPKRTPNGQRSNVSTQGQRQDRQAKNEFTRARDRLHKSGDMRDAGDAINAMMSRKERKQRNRFR